MKPNKQNFCGGNFQDWLEVMLTEKCNGTCSWCIEKKGYRPASHVSWERLCDRIIESGKKNIILLGGEPTLYPDLGSLVAKLSASGLNVYITTNGSRLTEIIDMNWTGINISIHDYHLVLNRYITGIDLDEGLLLKNISELRNNGVIVRLNCNLIKGYIDSEAKIMAYVAFAKYAGVNSIRFAELKGDLENFVNLFEIFGNTYGINNQPFGLGCNTDVEIHGMPVNFRQMCGLQTTTRERPVDPEQVVKQVLYYDGNIYNGWQTKENDMTEQEVLELLIKLCKKDISLTDATNILMTAMEVDNSEKKEGHSAKELVDAALAGEPLGCAY